MTGPGWEAPWEDAPRWCRGRALPAYRHWPGRTPHPHRDSRGHSCGCRSEAAPAAPGQWTDNLVYLYGIDLYHQGYFWEAHEAWETLWIRAVQRSREKCFYQGLILLTVGMLKAGMGNMRGACSLSKMRTAVSLKYARKAKTLWASMWGRCPGRFNGILVRYGQRPRNAAAFPSLWALRPG